MRCGSVFEVLAGCGAMTCVAASARQIRTWGQFVSDLSWPVPMVLLAALGLGLLTEGLQLVAIGRDARWRDVGIDVLGAQVEYRSFFGSK